MFDYAAEVDTFKNRCGPKMLNVKKILEKIAKYSSSQALAWRLVRNATVSSVSVLCLMLMMK
jgi:hypothetical protein